MKYLEVQVSLQILSLFKARKTTCLSLRAGAVSDILCFYHHFNWYSEEESWTHYKDWSHNHGWIHSDRTLQISRQLLHISLSTPLGVVLDTLLFSLLSEYWGITDILSISLSGLGNGAVELSLSS